jgi:peptidoglycan/LPS O-acetylase OafA/YrhL
MAAKQHFVVLDGLRGVAAVCVAIYHGTFIFGGKSIFGEAYLAVDFFFLLSGVVIARAYEERLRAGRTRDYLVSRAIRLYPMILVGASLGAAFYATSPQARAFVSQWTVAGLYALAILSLPLLKDNIFPPSHGITPLNIPSWSLFFELFVNALYGVIAKHLHTRRLCLLVIVSFCFECAAIHRYRGANFGFHISEFWWGFPRVMLPFFAGVLLHRVMTVDRLRGWSVPPSILALLLMLTFALSIPTHPTLNAIADLAAIVLVYPAIIAFAMRARVRRFEGALLIWLGALSYPLYIVHHPLFLWLARILRASGLVDTAPAYLWIFVAIVCSSALAAAIYYVYDVPVRSLLTRTVKSKVARANGYFSP